MAVLPSTAPYPAYENVIAQRFKTIISVHDEGNEQRRAKWDFPRYDITLNYSGLDSSQMQILWNFYTARKGAYEAFYYYAGKAEGISYAWTSVYVATGDGTSTSIPFCGISPTTVGISIYKNASILSTTTWAMTSTDGVNDEDTLTLKFTPTTGDVITASFSGYLKCRVRFKEDNMSRSLFEYRLYRSGLELLRLGPTT